MKQKAVALFVLLAVFALLTAFAVPAQAGQSAQSTPTAAPAAATPTPAASELVDANGMKAWCLPKGSVITRTQLETDAPPANAKPMRLEKDVPTLITVNDACTFLYTSSKAIPEGTQLQIADGTNAPWLKVDLTPGTQANSGYAAVQHGYIVDPPFWSVTYTVKVVTTDGAELWSSPMVFRRGYEPGKCYDGSWPDPVTWYCYYPPDAHPWDSYYKFENPKP